MAYSYNIGNEADFAKARVEGVNASYKDLTEVCYNIRKRPVDVAVQILEDAKDKKIPLRYRSHNTRMAHRKELQGQKGRWPIKCAAIVLKCLQSAVANAKEKGLSEELIVAHASANKKRSYMRYASKGRRNVSKLETARVEIVLREKVEGRKKRLADEKKAAEEKKKADAAKKEAEVKAAKEKAAKPIETKPGEIKPAPEKAAGEAGAGEDAPKPGTPAEKVGGPAEKKEAAKPKVEGKPAAKAEGKAAPVEKKAEKPEDKKIIAVEGDVAVSSKEEKGAMHERTVISTKTEAPPKKEEKDEVA